ncbi:3'-N-debenzoyl-2'-deoxytaxol N-benzoyltransferase-like [Hordeum vulgare]|nr:3'-N-debenzoyl-2'-deoxytaxol N-benzoyltransferase-like [Hordeum vulgare]
MRMHVRKIRQDDFSLTRVRDAESYALFPVHPVSLDPLDVLQAAIADVLGLFPQLVGCLLRNNDSVALFETGEDDVALFLMEMELSVAYVDADRLDSPLLDHLVSGDIDDGLATLVL